MLKANGKGCITSKMQYCELSLKDCQQRCRTHVLGCGRDAREWLLLRVVIFPCLEPNASPPVSRLEPVSPVNEIKNLRTFSIADRPLFSWARGTGKSPRYIDAIPFRKSYREVARYPGNVLLIGLSSRSFVRRFLP